METTIIDESKLTEIGNAIREKTGGTSLLTPAEMVAEIGTISTATPAPWTGAQSTITFGVIKVAYDYRNDWEKYGDSVMYIAGALSASDKIDMSSLSSVEMVIGWTDKLVSGVCTLVISSSVLSQMTDEQKNAITAKGFTLQ